MSRRLSRLWYSESKDTVLALLQRTAAQTENPTEFVDMLDKAIQQGRKCYIWYTPANGSEEMRLVSPLAWQAKNGIVLLVAYNNHGETRTYRLDRIRKVKESWTDGLEGPYSNYYDYYADDITRQFE